MAQNNRIGVMTDAAKLVVKTLTVGDHVGIVSFSTNAQALLGGTLIQASEANKQIVYNAIDSLYPQGSTDYIDAFNVAFDVLHTSRAKNVTSHCNTAILFLTDGEMTKPIGATADDVVQQIQTRELQVNVKPRYFLYSFGSDANAGAVYAVPKRIACATGGMWSRVNDGGDLSTAMANYYKVFAFGLSDFENDGFVACKLMVWELNDFCTHYEASLLFVDLENSLSFNYSCVAFISY